MLLVECSPEETNDLRQMEAPTARPDDLSSISSHEVKERINSCKLSSDSHA